MDTTPAPVDQGRTLNVISWLLLVVTATVTLGRLGTKWLIIHRFELDDLFIVIALLASVATTASISAAVSSGFGEVVSSIDSSDAESVEKSIYVTSIFYTVTLWASKLAAIWLIKQLSGGTAYKSRAKMLSGVFTLWTVASIFVLAFQCALPTPWAYRADKCINNAVFWSIFEALNILSDATVVGIAIHVFGTLQMDLRRKVALIACFASRILVVGSSVAHAIYASQAAGDVFSPVFWISLLCIQLTQNLSVSTVSIPYLKPLYLGLSSGMVRSDDLRRLGLTGNYGYGLNTVDATVGTKLGRQTAAPTNHHTMISISSRGPLVHSNRDSERGSEDTHDRPSDAEIGVATTTPDRTNVINCTTTWTVETT